MKKIASFGKAQGFLSYNTGILCCENSPYSDA
ncbi:hypothetical protein SAMN05444505_11930 [Pseudomonas syringae]|uniref:Uncharacterized protein n=1 Tax=Pseudomonas syringae TaxID=317 RepID=A0AB37ZV74_PSESX|nr:hypothetical protein SAMN05444505_11930 [Pseudomonas syringae]